MDRRKFLKNTAIGLGGIAMLPACVYEVTPYQFFTETEATCIIAITDQIIPEDESGPGAVYANVVNYIDRQLAEVFISDQTNYRNGIKALQQECKKMHGELFENTSFDLQTKLLEMIEPNNVDQVNWKEISSSKFFNMVLNHTMQGFYGSPRHGGNKNYISYRMMNLEYPLVVGQNRYRL